MSFLGALVFCSDQYIWKLEVKILSPRLGFEPEVIPMRVALKCARGSQFGSYTIPKIYCFVLRKQR